jgi:hypothetical protein
MAITLGRRLAVLVVAVLVALMMVAGPALAAPGNRGQGAAQANPHATFGITTAVAASGGGCDIACE